MAIAAPIAPSARPAQPPSASAQVNARIAPDLKERGDAALARAGVSPTQAVRALWELAARYADDPASLLDTLYPDRADRAARDTLQAQEERARAIEQGPSIVRDAYRTAGIPWPTGADVPYDDLMEAAYAERYGAGLGWDR